MVDVTIPPEIPLKILNVFTEDGEIRVKEDNLREVLSRFRNYSRDITVQVLSTLRSELADQVGAVRDAAELARAQLAQDLSGDLASKDVLLEVEDLARSALAKADDLGAQLKSMDSRQRQMAATLATQAQMNTAVTASTMEDDLAATAPAVMSSASLHVEPTPSESVRMPARGATFSPRSDAGSASPASVAHLSTSRSGTQARGNIEVAPASSSKSDEAQLAAIRAQEALVKEAMAGVAKVKEEVADLATKQEEMEKSLRGSASCTDLEAIRRAHKAVEDEVLQLRLAFNEDLAELRQFAKQTCEEGNTAITSRLDSDKVELESGLEALSQRTSALEAVSANEDERLSQSLRALGDRLTSVEDGLKLAKIDQMQEYIDKLTTDIAAVAQTTEKKAEGSEVSRAFEKIEEANAKISEEGLRLSSVLQRIWPNLEKLDDRALKLEGWNREAVREIKALRGMDSEFNLRLVRISDEVQDAIASSEEKYRVLKQSLQMQANSVEEKDLAASELITSLEERVETLEMDLERETRRAKEKVEESIHDFSDKICAFEEVMKDKEQAVHFGARCLSCNRAFDDVVKTSGSVNLPAEKRRAQVFAEIQRALHTPRTDPESIKLLAVKVGRPTAVKAKQSLGHYASRDGESLASGLEDVQLIPVRAHSSLSRTEAPSLPTRSQFSPRPPSKSSNRNARPWSETTSSCWTHRRGEAPSPGNGRRARTRSQVNEDIKSMVS